MPEAAEGKAEAFDADVALIEGDEIAAFVLDVGPELRTAVERLTGKVAKEEAVLAAAKEALAEAQAELAAYEKGN